LLDVFVVAEHRGHGFSRRLLHEVVSHPKLQGLRRFTLTTTHAHGLYAAFGFAAPRRPDALMERYCPDVYGSAAA
jgi:GNAT superfamily N-acetyltransferase